VERRLVEPRDIAAALAREVAAAAAIAQRLAREIPRLIGARVEPGPVRSLVQRTRLRRCVRKDQVAARERPDADERDTEPHSFTIAPASRSDNGL
jgi:hypothetical protein